MEIVAWLGSAVVAVLGFLWSLVWFLISGWVSTLLQIAFLIATIYFFKYGWQRAPAEIWRCTRSFGRFFWTWLRAREPQTSRRSGARGRPRRQSKRIRRHQHLDTAFAAHAPRPRPPHDDLKGPRPSQRQSPQNNRHWGCLCEGISLYRATFG
jgi:hypothetical protein